MTFQASLLPGKRGRRPHITLADVDCGSAVIVPSRLMRAVMMCYGAANPGAALAIVSGAGNCFHPRLAAVVCMRAAVPALRALRGGANARRIDISGPG